MDYGYEDEAFLQERWEADIEQAQYVAEANAAARAREAGVCGHNSRIGKSRATQNSYPVQAILQVGEEICTEGTGGCRVIAVSEFDDDSNWSYVAEWEPHAWAAQDDLRDKWLTRVSEHGDVGAAAAAQLA